MRAYKVLTTIGEDRRLVVHLPSDAPVGAAEVVVLVDGAGAAGGEGDRQQAPNTRLVRLLDELRGMGPGPRTREEIDRAIDVERASWQ